METTRYQAEMDLQNKELEKQRDQINGIQKNIMQEKNQFDQMFRKVSFNI